MQNSGISNAYKILSNSGLIVYVKGNKLIRGCRKTVDRGDHVAPVDLFELRKLNGCWEAEIIIGQVDLIVNKHEDIIEVANSIAGYWGMVEVLNDREILDDFLLLCHRLNFTTSIISRVDIQLNSEYGDDTYLVVLNENTWQLLIRVDDKTNDHIMSGNVLDVSNYLESHYEQT